MKQLESKDLVLKISGEVQASNLEEFEQEALTVIAGIKTELVTDNDFAEAKDNIKSCRAVEIHIANAKQKAIMSMDAVSKMMLVADRLQDKFRDTRLLIEKLVKTEEAARKSEITGQAVNHISARVASSTVKHGFMWNKADIINAIKGKRSLENMKEAVDGVVANISSDLEQLEIIYGENTAEIAEAEKEYPGLFPDKKNLALSPCDVVAAQIETRITSFKYQQKLKEEADKKAEEDRLVRESAAKSSVEEVAPPNIPDLPPDPFAEAVFPPREEVPPPPSFSHSFAPDVIYLQLDGDGGADYISNSATWSDRRIYATDQEYRRAQ